MNDVNLIASDSFPSTPLGAGGHRIAFKMTLFSGQEAEYKKRHDELWPYLQALLKATRISEYSIFLDETTNSLFGVLKAEDPKALDDLPSHAVMQKWWLIWAILWLQILIILQ